MNYVSKLDFFASNVQLKTSQGDTTYKTFLGGLLTIIIYTLSLMFTIYVLTSWQNGSIPPKVSSSSQSVKSTSINIASNTVTFELNEIQTPIFSEKQNIITPIFIELENGQIIKQSPVFSETNKLNLGQFKLIQPQSSGKDQVQKQYSLIFVGCQQVYLGVGQSCAPQMVIDQMLSAFIFDMQVGIELQQYNQKLDKLEKITKYSYLVLDRSIKLYTQIQIQIAKLRVDKNIFIENLEDKSEFPNNYQVYSQTVSQDFTYGNQKYDFLAIFLLQVDNIYTEQQISYPKIGEILAQIGSITSIIISLKILAEYVSQQKLAEDLIDMVLKLKYPNFYNISIKRNCYGKTLDIKYKDQRISQSKFLLKYNELREEAIKYMQLNHLIGIIIQLQIESNANINQPIQLMQNEISNQKIHPLIVSNLISQPQSLIIEEVDINQIFT